MAKVSIGLRGWRFEESEIFTDEGEFKPLEEIPADPKERLVRLSYLIEKPCDACYLIHGEEEITRCNQARIVYGEPMDEVLLCDRHEADFLFWFREVGGRDLVGDEDFRDAFHEWFVGGGRAPEGYAGIEHVDTDPDDLPTPPDPQEIQDRLNEHFEGRRIDIRAGTATGFGDDEDGKLAADSVADGVEAARTDADTNADEDEENGEGDDPEDDLSLDDVDFGIRYPKK
ncbi:hypothetical protein [Halegenticoccus soli]|uniref:hypothetical protein n=1 Tax=Halegenticoccus soli TaxID=1985678 RepID=UPI000C6D8EC2|nr:hypothetical protein [Halegenticoccus soli]